MSFIMGCPRMLFFVLIVCTSILGSVKMAASSIDLDYGLLGDDNIPPPSDVIDLYKSIGITKIRIFDPNTEVLNALRGHLDIGVIVGVKNEDLAALAASEDAVEDWFATNIEPYLADVNVTFITVGKEVIQDIRPQVLPVMQSLTNLVKSRNLPISISTVVAMSNDGNSYPPSAGMFTSQVRAQHVPVLNFLSQTNTPILVDIYPYFEYPSVSRLAHISSLDYNYHTNSVVENGYLKYSNLIDSVLEDFVWAMEEEGVKELPVMVSETGWSSAGNGILTVGIMRFSIGTFPSKSISGSNHSVSGVVSFFTNKGITTFDAVALLGAHTVGQGNCVLFNDRITEFQGTGRPDPSMDPALVTSLRNTCRNSTSATVDQSTPLRFDTQFIKQIQKGRGVFQVDQRLASDPQTRGIVARYANNSAFFKREFGRSMVKMEAVYVLTGHAGEIRKKCRRFLDN